MTHPDPADEHEHADVVPLHRASVVPDDVIEELEDEPEGSESDDAVLVVDLDAAPAADTDPADELAVLAEQAVRVGAGLAIGAVSFAISSLRKTLGTPDRDPHAPAPTSSLLTGAVLGVAAEAALISSRIVAAVVRRVAIAAEPAAGTLRQAAQVMDARWRGRADEAEQAAQAAVATAIPDVTRAVLDRLDLTALVVERVDLDEMAAGIDPDRIVERVDLQTLVERLDIDAIVAEVDIDAVIDRVDLAALAREVIDELDVPDLIRESAGGITGETVDEVRIGSANADRAIARAIDRVLRRRGRDLDGPAGADS
ncbi:MAG: hypothetical protein WEA10_00340 [Actinomycetota bacterium]